MKIAGIQADEDLTKFVDRVFSSANRGQRRQVLEAIRAANPHLSAAGPQIAGTPVLIPDLPDIKVTPQPVGDANVPQFLLEQARRQLPSLAEALTPKLDQHAQQLRATLEVAQSDLKKAIGRDQDLKARVAEIVKTTQAELDQVEKLRQVQKEALAELDDDLNRFIKRTTSNVG